MNKTHDEDTVSIDVLSNGLSVIVEEIDNVKSASYHLLLPGGLLSDEKEFVGSSLVLAELLGRGAGDFDSMSLSDEFEKHGISHSESAGYETFSFKGVCLAEKLPHALFLLSLIVLKPHLRSEEIENIASVLLQDIYSLTDYPSRWVMQELSKRYYPEPFNRPSIGTESGIKNTTIELLKTEWQKKAKPDGAVLSIAGNVNRKEVISQIQSLFNGWEGKSVSKPHFTKVNSLAKTHIHHDSAQLQIALAYPSVKFGENHYYTAKVTNGVLSGGMFGRLFLEVREKKGLCYAIYSSHSGNNDYGTVMAYAATTPDRAHETLEGLLKEISSVSGTVTEQELKRSKANLKASLVIGEESTSARCSSNASDWWLCKRVRSIEEVLDAINKVSLKDIDTYCEMYNGKEYMLVTLGSKEL
jgi:predicted Zn-dependent peptidase